jgi:23S rRNA pseudouridine1911/1915/1917 synthase
MAASRARSLALVASGGDQLLVQVVADLLRNAFPDLPVANADARRAVVAGAVGVNGRTVTRPGARVRAGERVSVRADPSKLALTRRPPASRAAVLYVDEHLVAVDKPAGLPTHATADEKRPHLVNVVARQLGVAESALGVHQRLDAGTSGIVLFARTMAANRGLSGAFERRAVEKIYLAVVDAAARSDFAAGHAWVARDPLVRAGEGRRGRRIETSAAGQPAETAFVVRGRSGSLALVEARPRTGRQHQIRAHLAAASAPILGDTRYGGPPAGRLHLHAWRLLLEHPVSGTPLELEAPPPGRWMEGVFA